MDKQPLVSVIVVCYNAAEYIEETLESVKAQTYKNIELIVSDDCSKDGTPDIVREWLDKNSDVFVRTELVTIDHNTGVSANYNRAVRACRGEWVKNIDGDDLITEDCIQENIEFVNGLPNVNIVFSNALVFRGRNKQDIIKPCIPDDRKSFFCLEAEEQFKALLCVNILPSQTCFIKLKLLQKYPYNEQYVALEDAPMWVNLTKAGNKIYYFDKITAYYRVGESMTTGNKRFYSLAYAESVMLFFWNDMFPSIKKLKLEEAYNYNRRFLLTIEFATSVLKNKKNPITNFIFLVVRRFIFKHVFFNFS